MNDPFIVSDEISKKLQSIENMAEDLFSQLPVLEQKVDYIFSRIKDFETIEQAEVYFKILDTIQSTLAVLMFTYDIALPGKLKKFTIDFDNFEEAKYHYFKKIKAGTYSL